MSFSLNMKFDQWSSMMIILSSPAVLKLTEQYLLAGAVTTNGDVSSSEDPAAPNGLPKDGSEWVELFVREMMSASNIDDARARASRALEVLEKSILAHASGEGAQSVAQVYYCCYDFIHVFCQFGDKNILGK